ncbi:MAG TPA: TIGR04282 family arsenosugar biosynthesis glycosyltransferase [Stellaceae bacterium]|nr:TIGR04282 family arsenosugar biosynthesis glycosyltransferase [Stellaceae bacterium]
MAERPTLVVFARVPRLGRVKSRLARDIGALAALHFHRTTTERLLRRLKRERRWRSLIAVTPDFHEKVPRSWRGMAQVKQGRGDLGRRMYAVIRRFSPGKVVIVGSDIPALRPRHIAEALAALGSHDAVFGPALDGGYWLIGLRAPLTRFEEVRWSSEAALADTLAGFRPGTRIAFLEPLEDIDDGAAWRRFRRQASDVPGAAA